MAANSINPFASTISVHDPSLSDFMGTASRLQRLGRSSTRATPEQGHLMAVAAALKAMQKLAQGNALSAAFQLAKR
jgi:hypothetical protein